MMQTTDNPGKVLVVAAHPDLAASKANRAMLSEIGPMPDVITADLYAEELDPERYEAYMAESKALVLQFPFYWAAAPARMKQWTDEVFMALSRTGLLQGKTLAVATTAGSEFDAYRSGGRNRYTMDELLRPYQFMANHTGMTWQSPFVIYGLGREDADRSLAEGVAAYRKWIEALAG